MLVAELQQKIQKLLKTVPVSLSTHFTKDFLNN